MPELMESTYLQDIHSISSLLKMYFRELPNPLLTYQLYDKFAVSGQGTSPCFAGVDSGSLSSYVGYLVLSFSFFLSSLFLFFSLWLFLCVSTSQALPLHTSPSSLYFSCLFIGFSSTRLSVFHLLSVSSFHFSCSGYVCVLSLTFSNPFYQEAVRDEDNRLLRIHDVVQQLPPPHYR